MQALRPAASLRWLASALQHHRVKLIQQRVEFDKYLAGVGVAAPVASRYSRSVSQLRRVSINAVEGQTLTSSSIIGPPDIRCINPNHS